MRAARELVERAAHGTSRAHLRDQHRLRPFRLAVDSRGADRASSSSACFAVTRAASAIPIRPRSCVQRCSCARTRWRKGMSGARIETVELLLECLGAWRSSPRAQPRIGRCERRPRTARAPGATACRRGRGVATTENCSLRRRRARRGRARADSARGEGGAVPHQRNAVHGGVRRARRHSRASPDARGRHRVLALPRGTAGLARRASSRRSSAAPAARASAAAANVRQLIEGSAINEAHRWCDKVQDAYSLRCAPQVHGAARDLLDYVEGTVAVELNAATDNPLVLVEDELLVSNGNFHGQPIAFALDALAMACSELANISERRVERLVNPNLLRRAAGVPHLGRRTELGLHDPAIRGGVTRQ